MVGEFLKYDKLRTGDTYRFLQMFGMKVNGLGNLSKTNQQLFTVLITVNIQLRLLHLRSLPTPQHKYVVYIPFSADHITLLYCMIIKMINIVVNGIFLRIQYIMFFITILKQFPLTIYTAVFTPTS